MAEQFLHASPWLRLMTALPSHRRLPIVMALQMRLLSGFLRMAEDNI